MKIDRDFCREHIYIDFEAEILFSREQAYISYPVVFPVVGFELIGTAGLYKLADEVRAKEGQPPLLIDEDNAGDGWYNFYICVNGWTQGGDSGVDNCISFTPVATGAADDEQENWIELDEEAQLAMYDRLDELCREELNRSLADLLKEAEEETVSYSYRPMKNIFDS